MMKILLQRSVSYEMLIALNKSQYQQILVMIIIKIHSLKNSKVRNKSPCIHI